MKIPALKTLLIAATVMISATPALSQEHPEQYIKGNIERSAALFHAYEYRPTAETQAPEGYKAFYVSHFGRHGSRRNTKGYAEPGYEMMKRAKDAGILTQLGEELYKDVSRIYAEHVDMIGELSERGAREHREIAERLYNRFPEVFEGDRKEVDARSSIVPRCIISMASFTSALDDCAPQLKFDFHTGKKYFDIINHINYGYDYQKKRREQIKDSLIRVRIDPSRFMASIIKADPDGIAGDPYSFMEKIYLTGAISGCLDLPADVLEKYFTFDELVAEYDCRNVWAYYEMGNSEEYGNKVMWAPAQGLARDFIDRADSAICPSSDRAADLRFGHDTGVLPMACLLNLEEISARYPAAEVSRHWQSFFMVPMASNLQLVYFRNDKNDIIVKIYYNERETKIDGLKAFSGPYYRWQDLKAWINERVEKVCASIK